MTQQPEHTFDKDYWQELWRGVAAGSPEGLDGERPNPYLLAAARTLTPGTALDVGCGAGTEATWLACHGWTVTGADIAGNALARAAARAAAAGAQVRWVEADTTTWAPGRQFDLVTTHYAHPTTPQLELYARVAQWVAPGGTLLVVGHLSRHGDHSRHDDQHSHDHTPGHGGTPPAHASVAVADVTALLAPTDWVVVVAQEHTRELEGPDGRVVTVQDVVVQATRLRS